MENEQKKNATEEVEAVEVISDGVAQQMSILESKHEDAILNIYDNMDEMLNEANNIEITPQSTKEQYEYARKVWRQIKDTHVAVEKKREELKKPILECGRKLDSFVKSIYDPMVKAEKDVRKKMKVYEKEQERKKQERKKKEEQEKKAKAELDAKLHDLNSTLGKINQCKNKEEVEAIESKLSNINLKDFGERSDEAGFILQNLQMTCKTIKNALPTKESTEKEKQEEKEPEINKEVTKKTADWENKGGEGKKVKHEIPTPKEEVKTEKKEEKKTEPQKEDVKQKEKTAQTSQNLELELDFSEVADQQASVSNDDDKNSKPILKGSDLVPDYDNVDEDGVPKYVYAKFYYENAPKQEVRYKVDKK